MFTCLEDIVGIAEKDCPCLMQGVADADKIAMLTTSKSGLYTDNLMGGVTLKSIKDISGCRSFAEIALAAKKLAVKITSDDMVLALNQKYSKNKNIFVGQIGQTNFGNTLQQQRRYGGVRISPLQVSDGVLTLKGGTIKLDSPAPDLVLQIVRAHVNSDAGTIIESIPVEVSVGDAMIDWTPSAPIRLPLAVDGFAVEYYVVYDRTTNGGILPKSNKVSCGCGGAEKMLQSYVNVDGVEFDSYNYLTSHSLDTFAHGLVLNVDIRCDNQTFVCREYDENDAVSITLANAIWFKMGEILIEEVLKSPEVNRITMMNREYLWGKRNHFRAEYESRIKYLALVVNIDSTDCFICKNGTLFYEGIIS